MKCFAYYKILFSFLSLFFLTHGQAQPGILRGIGNRSLPTGGGGGGDSLQRRNLYEDSITISFRYIDSTRTYVFDSSMSDFTTRYPLPATYTYLGNPGTAARSLLFQPITSVGWDPGFHAFDVYKWRLDRVPFFNTTRPYTELGYVLGSQTQQIIEITHTQNIRPYWNAAIQYRLINAPGFFKNQKTNHNNYLFTSNYKSPKKRYTNYLMLLGNSLQASENGGLQTVSDLHSRLYNDRFGIPVRLGKNEGFSRDFFSTSLTTGNRYKEFNALMRQQYDFGKKDSVITDSVVIPLYYPRFRLEHTLRWGKYNYQFRDYTPRVSTDSFYEKFYDTIPARDTFLLMDAWRELYNDFSIYQFPDIKNQNQFLKVGIGYQWLRGTFDSSAATLSNVKLHGEYRNRTRNQKWDMLAFGELYTVGYNAGDYHAYISLNHLINKKLGALQIGFENSNRSPSFIYDQRSSFYLDTVKSFAKENTTHFFASANNPLLKLRLTGDYYVVSNYLYLTDYYKLQQESTLFTMLRLGAHRMFQIGRNWRWYTDVYVQKETGAAPVNVPLFYTRNRFALEGNFFKNLFLSTGLEVRYHTPYKADDYSPLLGKFFYQNDVQINNLPQVDAFFHFRIRSFKAYVRAENLNTVDFQNGFGFTNNNLAAPEYPYPGLVLRLGIFWSFVN
ncbi:MAG: hypothetical protein ICV51_09260 [Flavisolibacter sp.]|nr:hypothetical protein [Flavisolibacter sp.]